MDETNATPSVAPGEAGSVATPPPLPEQHFPNWGELQRERDELARTRPVPDIKDQFVEIRWFEAHRYDPELQAYRGDYVAIYQERIVAGGPDRLSLELACAKKFGVHPARILVQWIGDGRDYYVTLLDYPPPPPGGPDAQDPS